MSDIADIRMFAGLLRRQMLTILATIACILLFTAFTLMLLTPRYTAQALILVDTSAKNLLDPAASATTGLTDNSRVEGEVRIVQSDAVLLDVVRAGNLLADREFAPRRRLGDIAASLVGMATPNATGEGALLEVLASFKEVVRVRREGLTYLITVGVTSEEPEKAARLANLVASIYIGHQVDAKVASTIAARNSLQDRVAAAKDSLADYEGKLDAFVAANNVSTRGGGEVRVADAQFSQSVLTAAGPTSSVLSEMPTQFYSLQQSAQIARAQYQTLLTRLQDFETQASLQLAGAAARRSVLSQGCGHPCGDDAAGDSTRHRRRISSRVLYRWIHRGGSGGGGAEYPAGLGRSARGGERTRKAAWAWAL